MGPLRHFVEIGGRENRNPHPMFDCRYYQWLHPELAGQRINPLVHYLTNRARGGGIPTLCSTEPWRGFRARSPARRRSIP